MGRTSLIPQVPRDSLLARPRKTQGVGHWSRWCQRIEKSQHQRTLGPRHEPDEVYQRPRSRNASLTTRRACRLSRGPESETHALVDSSRVRPRKGYLDEVSPRRGYTRVLRRPYAHGAHPYFPVSCSPCSLFRPGASVRSRPSTLATTLSR